MFRPSTYPNSRRPLRNASSWGSVVGVLNRRTPMRWTCCPSAARGAARIPAARPLTKERLSITQSLRLRGTPASQNRQDFFEVWDMNVLSRGRRALLPHFGHCTVPLSCSRMDRLIVTARLHLSQWYSYTGMAAPLTELYADPLPSSDGWIVPSPGAPWEWRLDNTPPFHRHPFISASMSYWMISSARRSKGWGMVSPSAFAVLRLIT